MLFKYIQQDKNKNDDTLVNFELVTRISTGGNDNADVFVFFDDENFIRCFNYNDVNDFVTYNQIVTITI